jgi:hypothetical protein
MWSAGCVSKNLIVPRHVSLSLPFPLLPLCYLTMIQKRVCGNCRAWIL